MAGEKEISKAIRRETGGRRGFDYCGKNAKMAAFRSMVRFPTGPLAVTTHMQQKTVV